MKTRFLVTPVLMLIGAGIGAASNPMVGGGKMYATKDIIDNAVNSKDHTTLVAAVKAAGSGGDFEGQGPFYGICSHQ